MQNVIKIIAWVGFVLAALVLIITLLFVNPAQQLRDFLCSILLGIGLITSGIGLLRFKRWGWQISLMVYGVYLVFGVIVTNFAVTFATSPAGLWDQMVDLFSYGTPLILWPLFILWYLNLKKVRAQFN